MKLKEIGEEQKILVSICCLTYNHEKFIARSIESMLSQVTNFNFEILINDDFSQDSTKSILLDYQKKYPSIIKPIFQKENIFSTQKYGVRMNPKFNFPRARGKYIALCEGDDYWGSNNKLQEQVDFLELNPLYSGAYHDTDMVDELGNNLGSFRSNLPDLLTIEDTIAIYAPFHNSSFLFRKDCFSEPEFLNNIRSGDMAQFSIVTAKGDLKKIQGIKSYYVKHPGGITNSTSLVNNYHYDRIHLVKMLNNFHEMKFTKKAKKVINFHKRQIYLLKYQNTWMEKIVSKFLTLRYPI